MRLANCSRLLTAFIASAALSCNDPDTTSTPGEMIVGKWRYVRLEIPDAMKALAEPLDQMKLMEFEGMMKMTTWNYFKDGTFKLMVEGSMIGAGEGGTYTLINDGRVIEQRTEGKDGKAKVEEQSIVQLTEDTLKLGKPGHYVVLVKEAE